MDISTFKKPFILMGMIISYSKQASIGASYLFGEEKKYIFKA